MTKLSWKETAEAVGVLAIVASLVFVGLQIQQDHSIARAELNSLLVEGSQSLLEIRTRSEFSKSWAKMLEQPEDLSTDEILQINSFLQSVKESFDVHCLLVTFGVFETCEGFLRAHIPIYFGNRYAQMWWKRNAQGGAGLPEWVDEAILGTDPNLDIRKIEQIYSEM